MSCKPRRALTEGRIGDGYPIKFVTHCACNSVGTPFLFLPSFPHPHLSRTGIHWQPIGETKTSSKGEKALDKFELQQERDTLRSTIEMFDREIEKNLHQVEQLRHSVWATKDDEIVKARERLRISRERRLEAQRQYDEVCESLEKIQDEEDQLI